MVGSRSRKASLSPSKPDRDGSASSSSTALSGGHSPSTPMKGIDYHDGEALSNGPAFQLMGAGSRSKILHQLGEAVDLSPSRGSNAPNNGGNGSPKRSASPSRPSPFRKPSSFAGLGAGSASYRSANTPFSNTTSLPSPSHTISGSIASEANTPYFDIPVSNPAIASSPSSGLHMPGHSSPARSPMNTTTISYAVPHRNFGQKEPFSSFSSKDAGNGQHHGSQTFKIGLPPVAASPRTIAGGSPTFPSSGSIHSLSLPNPNTSNASPSGLVGARSASIPSMNGVDVNVGAGRWPANANGKTGDPDLADDGQLEEIVPWLYQGEDTKKRGSPSSTPSRSRQTSLQANHRPSVSHILRGSKSSSNVKAAGRSGSTDSNQTSSPNIQDKERKSSGKFMGMIRKKSSAFAGNFGDVLSSHNGNDASRLTPGSSKSRPRMSPRSASAMDAFPSSSSLSKDAGASNGKKTKKKKGGDVIGSSNISGNSLAQKGISLDTNLDEMEGIVDLNQPFAQYYSMSAAAGMPMPNGVHRDSNSEGPTNSPRPGTPPSPSQVHSIRRPSIATSMRYEFLPGHVPDMSPVSKRLGLNRRDSVDVIASMNRWSANGGLVPPPSGLPTNGAGVTIPVPDPNRKGSVVSLLAERRDSTGTTGNTAAMTESNWTAPDSWAVKPSGGAKDDDSDDDERGDIDKMAGALASLPPTPRIGANAVGDAAESTFNGIQMSAKGVPIPKRPGTSGGLFPGQAFGFSKAVTPMASVRIFKPDNAHTILSLPITTTVAELHSIIAKKPGFIPANSKLPPKSYKLYLRSRGMERAMASSEKPLVYQDRKFRQAGFDPESDRLEELGREDNSYLCKFIFKPEFIPSFRTEEEGIEGFEYIDLAGRAIENLPIFLYKHAHEIISLNLSRNSRLHLPTDFVQLCTSLRDLKLTGMGMKRIPQSVRQITGLTRLDISLNRIVDLEHCQLDETKELTTLYVYNNRLTSLPDYFHRFQALKYLNISNNRFETFPVVVCEIASLNDLDISFNSLTVLPPEIGKLKNLERLLMLGNNVTALPSTMSLLTHLRELDCRHNQIADFAPINSIPNLVTVRARYNAAKALEIRGSSLAHIDLSYNAITRFTVMPDEKPSALTYLDLANNRLETIPEDLYSLCPGLQHLALAGNKIRILSEKVGDLQKLGKLSMCDNALQTIPEAIGKLQHLHTLKLSHNKLVTIPQSIWNCSELVGLYLSSNEIIEFPDPPAVNAADGHDEADRKMSAASASRAVPSLTLSLKKLYLAYNRFRDEVFRPISLMSGLTVLNLAFNDIYEIPPGMLQKCYQLTSLYLSGNMLTSLPADDLERLASLKILHLNGNKLQTLPAELGKISNLHVLDVGSNALKYNISNWPYDWNWNWNLELRYLNLSGNKRLEIKPSAQPPSELSLTGAPVKRRNLSDFSALHRMRVLGLMDITLMVSVPDESEDRRVRTSLSSINEMGYGISDTLGSGDHLGMLDLVVPRFRGKEDECLFGLFDAGDEPRDGGSRITKFIHDQFVQRLTLELSRLRDEDVSQGLRRSFLSLNRDWGNLVTPLAEKGRKESDVLGADRYSSGTNSDMRSGASAVVCYIYKKTLYLANVGDAMAIVAGRTMLARVLSTKHEPMAADEVMRIRSAEGWISSRGLVNDAYPSARAFGRFGVFPAVNSEPTVTVLDLVDSDEFVIVANNGLWNSVSHQTAVDVAWEHRADPMLAAQKLRDLAIAYGSDSSVMVMVINVGDLFKSKQPIVNRGLAVQNTEADGFYDTKYVARRNQGSVPGLRVADEVNAAPQGTVALVFTDIRNSTALWETNPGMQNAMRIHHELLRRLIRAFDGYEVKTEGDAFMVSFSSVTSAVLWCFTVQLELLRADWPIELIMSEEGKELYGSQGELIYRGLSVRMGLHWGAPICEQDPVNLRMDYLGPMVNRAARVSGVAEGGQITASADAVEILRALLSASSDNEDEREQPLVDVDELDAATKRDIAAIRQLGFGIAELGERKLKGLETPEFLSLIHPTALAGRLTGGKSKEAVQALDGAEPAMLENTTQLPASTMAAPPLADAQEVLSLSNICLRLEALSAGVGHNFYEVPSLTAPSNPNSPAIGHPTSLAAPRRRITLSPHLLNATANAIRPDASEEQLLVFIELLVVRIENALSTLRLRQLGPFDEVLSALGDATKIDPQYIMHALQVLSSML